MSEPYFTIGHSNRGIEEFLELLRENGITVLADIRKLAGSRANPQFNQDALEAALAQAGIDYVRIEALGGLRGRTPEASADANALWRNASFHRYADYTLMPAFRQGLATLIEQGRHARCAAMCAEAVWWRCHRRIVADQLLAHGETVFHILGHGRIEPAQLTPGAVVGADHRVRYPAAGDAPERPPR